MSSKRTFTLTADELAEIEHAPTNDTEPEVQFRIQAIHLLSQGHTVSEVARKLNIASRTTVYSCWQRFKVEGVSGLADRPKSGRPLATDMVYREKLEAVLAQQPSDLGYDQPGWTVEQLAEINYPDCC